MLNLSCEAKLAIAKLTVINKIPIGKHRVKLDKFRPFAKIVTQSDREEYIKRQSDYMRINRHFGMKQIARDDFKQETHNNKRYYLTKGTVTRIDKLTQVLK